jgi:hypothetical protein
MCGINKDHSRDICRIELVEHSDVEPSKRVPDEHLGSLFGRRGQQGV